MERAACVEIGIPRSDAEIAEQVSAIVPPSRNMGIAHTTATIEPTVPGAKGQNPMPKNVASITDKRDRSVFNMMAPNE